MGGIMLTGSDSKKTLDRKLRMGLIGGGPGALIGEVHRKAARMDGQAELVAGAFDADPEKSKQMGQAQYVDPDRTYGTWEEMLEKESKMPEDKRLDFVSITTPNFLHFPMAKAFLEADFHVICEKPMTMDVAEAKELKKIVEKAGKVFALTHNYTGYPMVKHARHMAHTGILGRINKIHVEYPQDWLLTRLELEGMMQAEWRTDPSKAGAGGCLGDIGTHAENLARYITGLSIDQMCADVSIYAEGRKLDDDVSMLVRYDNGAKGILQASQILTGNENGLNIRVWGDKGAVTWYQENPNYLTFHQQGEPVQILRRGNGYLCDAADRASRIPPGHPEAFIEAFANIYMNAMDTVRANILGNKPSELELDFPDVDDGVVGMCFIETAIESSKSDKKWTKMKV
jgi:predicted dehydrogenase